MRISMAHPGQMALCTVVLLSLSVLMPLKGMAEKAEYIPSIQERHEKANQEFQKERGLLETEKHGTFNLKGEYIDSRTGALIYKTDRYRYWNWHGYDPKSRSYKTVKNAASEVWRLRVDLNRTDSKGRVLGELIDPHNPTEPKAYWIDPRTLKNNW